MIRKLLADRTTDTRSGDRDANSDYRCVRQSRSGATPHADGPASGRLVARARIVSDDEDLLAVFHRAFDSARSGDAEWLRAFIGAGGSPNLTNDKGDTLLILAAYHSHVEVVETLVSLSADVDRSNDNGQTALAAAVFRQSMPIVDLLLDAGADPYAGARSAVDIATFFDLPHMAARLRRP